MVHSTCAIFGTVEGVSKFEHQTPDRTMIHAAVVGHLLRGTVLEGKEFPEALEDAYEAVGEDARFVQRRTGFGQGPKLEKNENGRGYHVKGAPGFR